MNLGAKPEKKWQPRGFSRIHPHVIGEWNPNNTIYLGPGKTAIRAAPELRLTVPDGPLTRWKIPSWLHKTDLTYHRKCERWFPDSTLKAVSNGQEFVADVGGNDEAEVWLDETVSLICSGTTRNSQNE